MAPQETIPARHIPAYNRHHYTLLPTDDNETMGRTWRNYPQAFSRIDRRLEVMDQTLLSLRARMINLQAIVHNSQVRDATSRLASMVSVQCGDHPHTPLGEPIPNFPETVAQLERMNSLECRILLDSLDVPCPEWEIVEELHIAVRTAVGLTGF